MKNFLIYLVIFVVFVLIASQCSSDSKSSYDGYSDIYKTDSKYRSNVGSIADDFGISEREVDAKINAVTGGY